MMLPSFASASRRTRRGFPTAVTRAGGFFAQLPRTATSHLCAPARTACVVRQLDVARMPAPRNVAATDPGAARLENASLAPVRRRRRRTEFTWGNQTIFVWTHCPIKPDSFDDRSAHEAFLGQIERGKAGAA
jgi:hypothetical protein